VVLDQLDQGVGGAFHGDAALHNGLANVKIDLSRSASDVSEIGIGHLSWPVDNATHDGDLPGKYVYR
jgi:hypothetical protein